MCGFEYSVVAQKLAIGAFAGFADPESVVEPRDIRYPLNTFNSPVCPSIIVK